MTEQEFKKKVAANLAAYRKLNNITQLELAEKLNYSDKSISKWERGDGLPDLYIMQRLAELYGVSISDFISDSTPKKTHRKTRAHVLIPLLSVALVWLIAVTAFMMINWFVPALPHKWLVFIYALPISAIVLTVYSSLWWNQYFTLISVSTLIWTIPLCFVLTFKGLSLIWCVSAVLQIMEIMWVILRYKKNKKK